MHFDYVINLRTGQRFQINRGDVEPHIKVGDVLEAHEFGSFMQGYSWVTDSHNRDETISYWCVKKKKRIHIASPNANQYYDYKRIENNLEIVLAVSKYKKIKEKTDDQAAST